MSLVVYGHPFSSYTQKVLMALYEIALPFDQRVLDPAHPDVLADWMGLWPMRKMPVLVDDGRTVTESSVIIEHLQRHHGGPVAFLPDDPVDALEVRFMDRVFDHYVMAPVQRAVAEALRPDGRAAVARSEAEADLDVAYAWLETRLAGRTWAAGDAFGLADCAAAPALFYADWVRPIAAAYPTVRAYRMRLLARPSFARCVDEARPYRPLFPLGAPDRD